VGTGAGYNAYKVRPSGSQYLASGVKINVTNRYWDIAVTQGHFSMDGREPVKVATLEEFISNKNFAHEHPEEEPKDNGDKQNRSTPISRRRKISTRNMPGACRLT